MSVVIVVRGQRGSRTRDGIVLNNRELLLVATGLVVEGFQRERRASGARGGVKTRMKAKQKVIHHHSRGPNAEPNEAIAIQAPQQKDIERD